MWFKSIYLKTLRDFRIAILGWGVGLGLLLYAILAAVPTLITTPQARASLVSLASSFAWIADPIAGHSRRLRNLEIRLYDLDHCHLAAYGL